ncbi:MAG: Cobalamin adenosyltransferase, methylmalonyl-CoA mutase cofactor biosynthesis protein [Candidatus Tokpelaia hoelldobleri]|uniref:Corrinoid adenosyltransferase n=1 Tax=Candidatus Tokpelaia hoelldobleri TaxID=1902579 RepID=A0A1U9JSQ3_9HYPH|nr:MAG: Cobalamin adenosyltransferase, methylmalonyl-CoA mutase cofactor biosynthesis protein [Candidatus Tokpelaia hoelldoblerii]
MVKLNKIYTHSGDDGSTGLVGGARRRKDDLRVEAYGTVDETNAAIGMARLFSHEDAVLDTLLQRIQNELFDLGCDLATVQGTTKTGKASGEDLRIVPAQVVRLESEIDGLNENLAGLRSFVLPGGSALAAHLHLARTIARRAERVMVALNMREALNPAALRYINRLSDLLFVAARYANQQGANQQGEGDVLWVAGKTR